MEEQVEGKYLQGDHQSTCQPAGEVGEKHTSTLTDRHTSQSQAKSATGKGGSSRKQHSHHQQQQQQSKVGEWSEEGRQTAPRCLPSPFPSATAKG